MTNAEAWFNKSLRPRKPEGSLGRTAQDGHLDSHTAPELCQSNDGKVYCSPVTQAKKTLMRGERHLEVSQTPQVQFVSKSLMTSV